MREEGVGIDREERDEITRRNCRGKERIGEHKAKRTKSIRYGV